MKLYKKIINKFRIYPWELFCLACTLLFGVCNILVITGAVSYGFSGFGVDSAGRLYVGRGHKIEVYENQKEIYTIKKGTSRGFVFTVQKDDTILLASSNNVYVMDLRGTTTLKSWDESSLTTHKDLHAGRFLYQTDSGNVYTASKILGFLTISCGSNVVYTMPLLDYIIMILHILSVPGFIAYTFIFRRKINGYY